MILFLICIFLEVSDLMAERKETMTDLGETRLILKILQDWWMKRQEREREILSKDTKS